MLPIRSNRCWDHLEADATFTPTSSLSSVFSICLKAARRQNAQIFSWAKEKWDSGRPWTEAIKPYRSIFTIEVYLLAYFPLFSSFLQ